MFNDNENPYAPPSCPGCGEYDWSLAKRVFLTFSAIAGFCLLCNAVAILGSWSPGQIDPDSTWVDQIRNLMLDWKAM